MNRPAMRLVMTALAAALISVTLAVAGVTVDYDKEYDFSIRRTFAWGEGTPASELNEKRIVGAIEDQLGSRGFTLVNEEGIKADLIVLTHAASDEKTQAKASVGIGVSRRAGFGSVGVGTSVPVGSKTVTVGSLVVNILDAGTGDLVWQAHATGTVDTDPAKLEKKINKTVAKAFKKFPPKRKGK